MAIRPMVLVVLPLLSAGIAVPSAARADVLMQASARTQCLDMSSGSARLSRCNGSAAQNFISGYGVQRLNGLCLQGTGGNNATNVLAMRPCNGSKDQSWTINNSNGNYKNEGGWCAAATSSGTVIAAQCYGGGTYAWSTGRFMAAAAAGPVGIKLVSSPPGTTALPRLLSSAVLQPLSTQTKSTASNLMYLPGGKQNPSSTASQQTAAKTGGSSSGSTSQQTAQIVAGASNIVAQGGGNIVAQGGGNIVAQGGGNVISTTGGAINSN